MLHIRQPLPPHANITYKNLDGPNAKNEYRKRNMNSCNQWLQKQQNGTCQSSFLFYRPDGALPVSLRLYRLSTETRFSFPLGKATSPAAVPLRPLRPEMACSTPLITSRIMAAVMKLPGMGLPTGPAFVRHAHAIRGFRGLKNEWSMIPYIK